MSVVQLKEEKTIEPWHEFCRLIEGEDFESVTVEPGEKAIRFEYTSGRETIWQVGTAISLLLAAGLAAVFSVPLGFLITAVFVVLTRSTDDYLLLDAEAGSLCHVRSFAGRATRESLVDLDEVQSVHVVPVSQSSGSTNWMEYRLAVQSEDRELHPILTHTDSRSRSRADRIGEALAAFLNVPLEDLEQREEP